jgi:hypothetical protein
LALAGEVVFYQEHARETDFLCGQNVVNEVAVGVAIVERVCAADTGTAENAEFHGVGLDFSLFFKPVIVGVGRHRKKRHLVGQLFPVWQQSANRRNWA